MTSTVIGVVASLLALGIFIWQSRRPDPKWLGKITPVPRDPKEHHL